MSWDRERRLWSSAILGSVGLHVALGAALALAPAKEQIEKRETVITIHSIPEAFTQQAEASGEARESEIEFAEIGGAAVTDVAAAIDQSVSLEPSAHSQEAKVAGESVISATVETSTAISAIEAASALPTSVVEATSVPQAPLPNAVPSVPSLGKMVESIEEAINARAVGEAAAVAPSFGSASPIQPVSTTNVSPTSVAPLSVANLNQTPSAQVPVAAAPVAVQSVTRVDVAAAVSSPQIAPQSSQARPAPFAVTNPARPASARSGTAVLPVGPDAQVAVAVRPDAPLVLSPRATVQDVLARVRKEIDEAREGLGTCFIAKPEIVAEQVAVESFAPTNAAFEQLSGAIGDADVQLRGRLIVESQCAALAFAASNPDELAIELTSPEIVSGAPLLGAVKNISRNWFYLLTVDGEGRVQEVGKSELASSGEGVVSFASPVTLTGAAGETVQLIVAIASDEILETVWLLEGETAETYFPRLRSEIEATGASAEIGIAAFTVK